MAGLVYDMQSRRFGAESERVLELKLALADFLANPLTGIGSWGRYTGHQRISWQAGLDGGQFIHSGVLHIGLKTGLVGMALFAGTAWAFVHFSRRALRELPPELIGLGTAGVAGMRVHAARHPGRHAVSAGAHQPDAGRLPGAAVPGDGCRQRGARGAAGRAPRRPHAQLAPA